MASSRGGRRAFLGRLAGLPIALAASASPGVLHAAGAPKVITCFGDSLTAGYGLDPEQAWPALLQRRIDSRGLAWTVVNAGLSGETTAGGLRRAAWVLRRAPDLFILGLGGNDALRGIDPATTRANLAGILGILRDRAPSARAVLAGMLAPPSLGPEYGQAFASIYPELAKEHGAALVPFLLEGVAADPDLNLADGIHPNEEGQKILLENVWRVIAPMVEAG